MKQIVDKLNKIAKKIDESVEIPQTDLIIDSLDAITKAYGGTPNDSNLIVDKLEDIAGVAHSGITPSGNIAITENTAEGEPLDVSQYATATVNVAGGGTEMLHCIATIVNNTGGTLAFNPNLTVVFSSDGKCIDSPTALNSLADNRSATIDALYRVAPNDMIAFGLTELNEFVGKTLVATSSNAVNCSLMAMGNEAYVILTNAENPSSITITYTLENTPQ